MMKINEMQCKDFREIADSYLSDELLVETNHEVFRHLENCKNCRSDLGERREVRAKLRTAVINTPESQIDPAFAVNLRQRLEKEAFRGKGFPDILRAFYSPKIFAATAAALLVAFLIGVIFRANQADQDQIMSDNNLYKTVWTNLSTAAIDDHVRCALDKYSYWKKNDVTETAEEKAFKEKVLNQFQSETAQNVNLVSIHDCKIGGRNFHHAIVDVGEHIVSVTQTVSETDNMPLTSDVFELNREKFELAGFTGKNETFYVVSDLPRSENLRLAQIFSGILKARNGNSFKFTQANYALYTGSAHF